VIHYDRWIPKIFSKIIHLFMSSLGIMASSGAMARSMSSLEERVINLTEKGFGQALKRITASGRISSNGRNYSYDI
jgi:hypothetical protein